VILVKGIQHHHPRDAIVSEEGAHVSPEVSDEEPRVGTWYVDPIDGTSSYVEGLSYWGPTVARRDADGWDLGALYLPRLGDTWFASRKHGAWLGTQRLSACRDSAPPPRTILMPSRAHHLGPLQWSGRTRCLGGTAAHLALVASGAAAATLVPAWSPWDVGCGLLLIELTGHVTVDLSGRPCDPMMNPGEVFVAGTPADAPRVAHAVRDAFASLSGS
jgi:myo-inositol-1(or 4)-monophosphatase